MALEGNKADLVLLLSSHMIERSPKEHPVVVAAAGFADATTVKSSDPDLEVSTLRVNHEEADTRLILKDGTLNASKYFPVHEIRMLVYTDLIHILLAFHAITGCDTESRFGGHGKKTARMVFKQQHTDLIGLGKGSPTENIATSTEKFICNIYAVCPRLTHGTSTSQLVLYQPYTRDSATDLRCSKVSHHAFIPPSKCLEPRTLAVP